MRHEWMRESLVHLQIDDKHERERRLEQGNGASKEKRIEWSGVCATECLEDTKTLNNVYGENESEREREREGTCVQEAGRERERERFKADEASARACI